jgi:hypothetical protein
MPCARGIELLEIRDKAIDATLGIMVGKIVGHPDTPADRARYVKYADAVLQTDQPAYAYNQHLKGHCDCNGNPPKGRYSKP